MSDRIVTLRHRQVCDLCHHFIDEGERCHLVRDDFWPGNIWFEHCICPKKETKKESLSPFIKTPTPTNNL